MKLSTFIQVPSFVLLAGCAAAPVAEPVYRHAARIEAAAPDLNARIDGLAARVGKALVTKDKAKVAAVDFVDLQGRASELGRFLAEGLTVALVNVDGVSVVDRAHIKPILAEHKLTEAGLIDPANAKILGLFAGIDVLLTGTLVPMGDGVQLTVKAISTETSEVVAAGQITIDRTPEVSRMLSKAAPSTGEGAEGQGNAAGGDSGPAQQLRDLNVTLTSAKMSDSQDGGQVIHLTFNFWDQNLQDPLVMAANGGLNSWGNGYVPRWYLEDAQGGKWEAPTLGGLPLVAVKNGGDPAMIGDAVERGRHFGLNDYVVTSGGFSMPGESAAPPINWGGGLVSLQAGETQVVSADFKAPSGARVAVPLQLVAELVLGKGRPDRVQDCVLKVLKLENITLK